MACAYCNQSDHCVADMRCDLCSNVFCADNYWGACCGTNCHKVICGACGEDIPSQGWLECCEEEVYCRICWRDNGCQLDKEMNASDDK